MSTSLFRTSRASHVDSSIAKRVYLTLAVFVAGIVVALLALDGPQATSRFQTNTDFKKKESIEAGERVAGRSREQENGFTGGYIGKNLRIIPDALPMPPEDVPKTATFASAHSVEAPAIGEPIDFGNGDAGSNGEYAFDSGDLGLPEFPKSEWKMPNSALPDIQKPIPDKPIEIFLHGVIPPPALAQIQECSVVYSMRIEPCGRFHLAVESETPEGQDLARGVTPSLNDRLFVRPPEVNGEKIGATITFFVSFGPNQTRQIVSSDGIIVHATQ